MRRRDGRVSRPSQTSRNLPGPHLEPVPTVGPTLPQAQRQGWGLCSSCSPGQGTGTAPDPTGKRGTAGERLADATPHAAPGLSAKKPASISALRNQQPIKLSDMSYICFVGLFFFLPQLTEAVFKVIHPCGNCWAGKITHSRSVCWRARPVRAGGLVRKAARGYPAPAGNRPRVMRVSLFRSLVISGMRRKLLLLLQHRSHNGKGYAPPRGPHTAGENTSYRS